MSIDATVLKWGNSYGLRLSKKDVQRLNLRQKEQVVVEIRRKENPLKELFGAAKREGKKISRKDIMDARKMLESKYF